MSQLRLVVLLPLISAAGCYSDAPPASTFPDDHYVSGPPGGAMDPEPAGYANAPDPQGGLEAGGTPDLVEGSGEDQDGAPPVAAGDPPSGPVVAAPDVGDDGDVGAASPGDPSYADGVAQGDVSVSGGVTLDAGAPAPTASVTDVEINAALEGHGEWVENDEYGAIWRPDATQVGVDFTPYESGGSWAYTDAGWGFNCDYSWGWLPFHYGRWAWFQDSWGWVPGYDWSPAWVEWRHGGGVVGWRPLPPRGRGHFYPGTRHDLPRDHRRAAVYNAHWRFATTSDFSRRNIRSHLYRNPAEALRVTSRVNAPPLRARTAIRTGDLMRNRYVGAGRPVYGGTRTSPNQGIRRDPRYQAYGPQRPYAPGARDLRPEGRVQPDDNRRAQPYDGRTQIYGGGRVAPDRGGRVEPDRGRVQPYSPGRGPDRVQPYNPGTRTYQPTSRPQGVTPGTRTVQPGPRYAPPSRTGAPVRTWNPGPSSPPSGRTWNASPSSPQPSRSWNPPSAPSTRAPVSAPPSRSWSPPSAPSAPSRSAPSSAPAPSRSSAPSSSGSRNDSGGGRSGGAGGGHSSRR